MYDPECNYCPRCKEEYVATASRCADCGVDLVSGSDMATMHQEVERARQSRAGVIRDGDEVVTVFRGAIGEVRNLERILAKERIATLVTSDDPSCKKGCCGPTVYLNVLKEDALDALRLIEQEIIRTTGLASHDLSHADAVFNPQASVVQCPACGTTFTPNSNECPDCGLCF